MKAYFQLTLAQLRLFARNRQVLVWTMLFPIFFMVMLGSFIGKGNGISIGGYVVDEDGSQESRELVRQLTSGPAAKGALRLKASDEGKDQAIKALRDGDAQLVVVIPAAYGDRLRAAVKPEASILTSAELRVYYDETNQAVSQLGLAAIAQMADGVSKEATGYRPAITVTPEGIQSLDLRYIDFLVPGIVAMMIMSNNLNGVAGQIASWRERGILRRMQSTPLESRTFIAAQITARLVLNGGQALIVLLVGQLAFGTQVNGSWGTLLFFVVLGTLAFMSIGFIIAGLARTPESAGPIAGAVSFPMMFLGGVFFPIRDMPDWLQPVVNALPIAHLSTALREVMNVGASLMDVWQEAALLGAWLLVTFILASRTFKWE